MPPAISRWRSPSSRVPWRSRFPEALAAYLFATVTSLTQNAVRAIPLGQNAGQRLLRKAARDVAAAVARAGSLDLSDFGAVSPGLEISQMRHERQRARMFMS